jgi:hypothetical protein
VALLQADEEAAELARRGGAVVLPPGRRDLLAAEIERRYLAWREGGRAPDARPEWLAGHARREIAKRLAALLERARSVPR